MSDRPHSRACGITVHPHGRGCAPDCPTCAGSAAIALTTNANEVAAGPVTHVAGHPITFNTTAYGYVVRQRCAWCGANLRDVQAGTVAHLADVPVWPLGRLIEVDDPDGHGGTQVLLDWVPGQPVPTNACLRLPLEATS